MQLAVAARPSGRIPVVDGLRGFAVLSVLIYHFHHFAIGSGSSLWQRLYNFTAGIGWAGVDLFFVLSGFLITGILLQSVGRERYYRSFYFRRTVRIFPLYYASLVLFYGVGPAIFTLMHRGDRIQAWIQPSSQIFAWFYVLNWRMGLFSFSLVPECLHHFWSLSIEEQFYLAWPFVVRTVSRGRLVVLCPGLFAVSLILRVVFYCLHMGSAAYVLTFCRLDSLAVGGMIALAFRDDRYWSIARTAAPWLTTSVSIALFMLVGLTRSTSFHGVWMGTVGLSLWGLFFGGLLVMALNARRGDFIYSITSTRLLQFFGKYSYCLYVSHQPLIMCLARLGINSDNLTERLGSRIFAVLAVNAIAFLVVVSVALASWHLFEKHFLKLKDVLPAGRLG